MNFYGLTADNNTVDCPEDLEVNLANANARVILFLLGFEAKDGYFEADLDEFIGTILITPVNEPFAEYHTRTLGRLHALAMDLKARGAIKIYGA
jgi:hypothetical protein